MNIANQLKKHYSLFATSFAFFACLNPDKAV